MNRGIVLSCTVASAALLLGAGGASAKGDTTVRTAATCTPGVTGKLTAKNDGGVIEVEFEVDQNRAGVTWNWKIVRDGRRVRRGLARTHAPSGSFSVTRRIGNPVGVNRVAFRAVTASGRVCRAVVRV